MSTSDSDVRVACPNAMCHDEEWKKVPLFKALDTVARKKSLVSEIFVHFDRNLFVKEIHTGTILG